MSFGGTEDALRRAGWRVRSMPWEESLQIMKELDEIRRICGIRYPQDAE